MPDLTPVRIRGKRKGLEAEKWHHGKKRKAQRKECVPRADPSESGHSESTNESKLSRARRKKPVPELSRLEQLPTEVIQAIFVFSENVDLAVVSPRLKSQLSNQHLQHEVASRILEPILGSQKATSTALSAVTRLMNSGFFTYAFFETWLLDRFATSTLNLEQWLRNFSENLPWYYDLIPTFNNYSESYMEQLRNKEPKSRAVLIWHCLRPDGRLLPPSKLLRGPFTAEKAHFLSMLARTSDPTLVSQHPTLQHEVREGLERAISERVLKAVHALLRYRPLFDTALLRHTVINTDCQRDIVDAVFFRVAYFPKEMVDVNFLDPQLWTWADDAEARGDDSGAGLKILLRNASTGIDGGKVFFESDWMDCT
jgi:hypothetical protein